jgi:hypothetical protein
MKQSRPSRSSLVDGYVDTKIKLAALWASTTFCYVYGDYFELYVPGKLDSMLRGLMPPLGRVSEGVLLGTSLMLAIPCLMVALSVLLKAPIGRWLNIIFGVIFTLIMLAIAVQGGWVFYRFFALIEIALTSSVVWLAWSWPRVTEAGHHVT